MPAVTKQRVRYCNTASEPVKRVTIMMGYRGMLTMLSQLDFGHNHNRKKIVGTQASIEEKRRKVI